MPRPDGGGDVVTAGEDGGTAAAPAGKKTTELLYFHKISKSEAEGLITGKPDGTFLLRYEI